MEWYGLDWWWALVNTVMNLGSSSVAAQLAASREGLNSVEQACYRATTNKQTPWSESASELYRPSDRRLSAK
jgi:hypothetical protein